MRVLAAVLVAAALISLGGVAGYALTQEDGETETWNVCANPLRGYVIEFPVGWHVGGTAEDPGRTERVCSYFDPRPFQIPPLANPLFRRALEVRVPAATFEDALAALTDPRAVDVVEQTRAAVAHRRAVRLETEATGRGAAKRGTRTYGYLIDRRWMPPFEDLGLPPLLVVTTARREEDLHWKEVVDHAVGTLRLLAPTVPEPLPGAPDPVVRKYFQILAAAEAYDYDALAKLADDNAFSYTLGGAVEGGPAAYWLRAEKRGETPAAALAAILRLPYTLHRGIYVWPFAFARPPHDLTEYERKLLRALPGDAEIGETGYLGWRAGITPDGAWIFFIAGD